MIAGVLFAFFALGVIWFIGYFRFYSIYIPYGCIYSQCDTSYLVMQLQYVRFRLGASIFL